MTIRIKQTGISENQYALKQLQEALPGESAAGISESVQIVSDATHLYPPPIPDSRYVRTYTYFNDQTESYPIGQNFPMEGYVETPTNYDPYLRGDDDGNGQATIHKGRWESILDIRTRLTPAIVDVFVQRIANLVRRLFS